MKYSTALVPLTIAMTTVDAGTALTTVCTAMSANLCVQAHMHELLEQSFEVAVIKDATAAAIARLSK